MWRYPTFKFTHFEGLDNFWKQLFLLFTYSAVGQCVTWPHYNLDFVWHFCNLHWLVFNFIDSYLSHQFWFFSFLLLKFLICLKKVKYWTYFKDLNFCLIFNFFVGKVSNFILFLILPIPSFPPHPPTSLNLKEKNCQK